MPNESDQNRPDEKAFDCVEMKRAGADEVRRRLEGKPREERLAYWKARTEELKRAQRDEHRRGDGRETA